MRKLKFFHAPISFRIVRASAQEIFQRSRPLKEPTVHLGEAMEWLCRAQDACGGRGVSRSYSLKWMRGHQRRGWLAAYPETTGYIIPTFYNYAAFSGNRLFRDRAYHAVCWETEKQMECGAVQGGVIDFPPSPAIFNTGQVLFGWTRAYRETGNEDFRIAAQKAGKFLIEAQDPDGAWRRYGSQYARSGVNVYDARTAWGVAELFSITNNEKYQVCAIKNLDYVLSQQQSNGWFNNCCLDDNQNPLLHTIAYTMEGLLEAGLLLDIPRFVESAQLAARALLARQWPDGGLPGRFDSKWEGNVPWSCLTGDAQTAIVWFRLFELTGDSTYYRAGQHLNRFLMRTQNIVTNHPGIRGGIKGSQPIWAEYGSFEYLNWAAKFFADSLMLELILGGKAESA